MMPPVGMPHPDKAALDAFAGVPRSVDRRRRGGASQPRTHRPAPAQPCRVRQRRCAICWRSTSTSRRCCPPTTAAYGFDNIARRARRLAGADGALPVGGLESQRPGRRQPEDHADGRDVPRARPTSRRTITSKACRSARAAACSIRYTFPVDGEYVIQPRLYRETVNIIRGLEVAARSRGHLRRRARAPRALRRRRGREGQLPEPDRGGRRARDALQGARCP